MDTLKARHFQEVQKVGDHILTISRANKTIILVS